MANRRRGGSQHTSASVLTEAPLCVDEDYYRDLARPLLRRDAPKRFRDLTALVGPPLALVCALFIGVSLALATPARIRSASPLGPIQARFVGEPLILAIALVGAAPLLVALTLASLWARLDLMRERRIQVALAAKLRLARGYQAYLLGLTALTGPLAWARSTAAGADEPIPSVLVALSVSHDARWDEERPPAPAREVGLSGETALRPAVRFGWDASVEEARQQLPQTQTVETVTQALAQTASGAIILSGDEGAGKTTLMRYVAQAHAQAQLRRTRPGGRIPLYADLAWLAGAWPASGAQPGAAVEAALTSLAQRIGGVAPAVARDLARALARDPALLLFDELDTLPSEQREQVASSLAAFLAERRAATAPVEGGDAWTTQMVIGARSYAGPLGDGPAAARFQRWELEPLAYPMGRLALLRGALAQRQVAAPDAAAAETLEALTTPWTEAWLTQPLSLALAAAAHTGAPPATPLRARSDLYEAAVGALLRAHLPDWSDESRGAMWRLAEELALWLRLRGLRAFTPATPEIDQWLMRLSEAQTVVARSGVASPSQALAMLSGLCEAGPGGLACFSLDALHSFFAGGALARAMADAQPSQLAPGAVLPDTALALTWDRRAAARWDDTLALMCGALCSQRLARSDLAVAWLRAVFTQPDALERPTLLMAATCLPELRGDPQSALLAADIAGRLHQTLLQHGAGMTRAMLALTHRACVAAMADPVARQALLDLLCAQLLDRDASVSRRAALTWGALGQAGVSVAPVLIDLLRSTIWTSRAAVARAISALGPVCGAETVPALLATLNDRTPVVRAAVFAALGAVAPEPDDTLLQTLLNALGDPEGAVRAAAATALGRIGARETEGGDLVAETLLQTLSDTECGAQVAAALALGAIPDGGQQVPALIAALAAVGWNDRASAALALGALGQAATPALPALLTLAREDTVAVRTTAARALAQVGPQRPDALAALVERLSDEASETRKAAAEALAQMDSALPEMRTQAWPALLAALRDPAESVRWAAGYALGALGAAQDPHVATTLFTLLDDPRGYVRAAAALPLETLGGAAARGLPARIASLPSLRDEARLVAVETLGLLGAAAKAAAPALLPMLDDPRWEIRRATLRALRRIGPRRVAIIRSLASVRDPEAPVRLEAIATLAPLDRWRNAGMSEALQQRLLEDTDSSVRAAAATALGRLGPNVANVLPTLLRALGDGVTETQRAAALAIGALRAPQSSILPQLTARLSDPAPGVRGAVALALGALGPEAAPAVTPELLILLRDEVNVTRASAAEALGQLGPHAGAEARQALLQRLDDADTDTRAAAAEALGRIGAGDGEPWELIDALLTRTHDLRYAVRRAAVFALMLLGPVAVRASLPRLLTLLRDAEDSTRRTVAAALGGLDADGQAEALPWLKEALAAQGRERASAAQALAAMRAELGDADRDALTRLLADRESAVRAAAAQAVGALSETTFREGPPAGLGALLGDESWQARAAAAGALAHYGARVSAAERGALRAALADADETTRQAAAQALAQIDAEGVRALVGELSAIAKTRRATGTLAPLAQRRALEVYASMARPPWAIVERVGAWLSDETYWATQRGACALIEQWRYASAAARRRLLWLGERSAYPATRAAASAALRATLADSPDLDLAPPDDQRDIPSGGAASASAARGAASASSGRNHASRSQSKMSKADGALNGARPTTAHMPAGELALRIGGDEGRSA